MGIKPLPASLGSAIEVMEQSELVADVLGEHVFDFFLRNKRQEWQDYRHDVSPLRARPLPAAPLTSDGPRLAPRCPMHHASDDRGPSPGSASPHPDRAVGHLADPPWPPFAAARPPTWRAPDGLRQAVMGDTADPDQALLGLVRVASP